MKDIGSVIATRAYFSARNAGGAPVVTVQIGAPIKSSKAEDEFMCSFRLISPGVEQTQTIYGIDELQALQLALAHVDAHLRRIDKGMGLHWIGGSEGDLGIRIPDYSVK